MADSELVYSSEGPVERPGREAVAPVDPARTTLRLGRESQGRRGKPVTVLDRLPHNPAYFRALAKEIKTACGAGGTWKPGRIEVQGEHRDTLQKLLEAKGFRIRRAGG